MFRPKSQNYLNICLFVMPSEDLTLWGMGGCEEAPGRGSHGLTWWKKLWLYSHARCLSLNACPLGDKVGLDVPVHPPSWDLLWDHRREWNVSQDGSAAGRGGDGCRTGWGAGAAVCKQLPTKQADPEPGSGAEERWSGAVWWYVWYTLASQEV